MFENEVPHFLYLELSPDGIKISKNTQALAYLLFSQALFLGRITL